MQLICPVCCNVLSLLTCPASSQMLYGSMAQSPAKAALVCETLLTLLVHQVTADSSSANVAATARPIALLGSLAAYVRGSNTSEGALTVEAVAAAALRSWATKKAKREMYAS